jgi:hypothetical protein
MTKTNLGVLAVLLTLVGTPAWAQRETRGEAQELVPLSVQVTISRYQGDELVSSLPYMLAVTANESRDRSSLRMGADVPVLSVAQLVSADGEPLPNVPRGGPFTYRSVGTDIDCLAESRGDGRYQVLVNIEESSVYGDEETSVDDLKAPGVPVFRSFQSSNTLLLRDGQSRQYTAAADRVTGESIRVDVALTVLE